MWDLSCRDWEVRLAEGRSLVPDLPHLDRVEADRAIAVFNALRLPDVQGLPTLGEAGGEWFREIVGAMFGSVIDGVRMIRELFDLVPKKNSKTTNSGALMLTASLLARRPRAEFLLIGPTQLIADTAFNQALGMVLADPELHERVHVQQHIKKMTIRATGVTLQVKTFDENVLTGVKLSGGALIDEVHLLGEMAKAEPVMRQLEGGMMPYPESFLAMISTQSEKPPAGVFLQQLNKARAVRDGLLQARMLAVLYEFPERMLLSDEWRDRKFWGWVNPNMGKSVSLDVLGEGYANAVAKGEGSLRGWASQHLNLQIGISLGSNRWEGADHWTKNAEAFTFEDLLKWCDVIVFGHDGGGLDDLGALVALGRHRHTRKKMMWVHAWAFRGTKDEDGVYRGGLLERRKEIVPALNDFEAEGTLSWFDEPGEDVVEIVDYIMRVEEAGLLPEKGAIGVDPVGIADIVDALELRGITTESGRIVGISQGWMMSNTVKTVARWLAAGTLKHAGTKLMNWVMGNAKVEPRGNAVVITKQTAGTAKIDPLLALLDAGALMVRNPEAAPVSVYSKMAALQAPQETPAPVDEVSRYALARQNYAKQFLTADDD